MIGQFCSIAQSLKYNLFLKYDCEFSNLTITLINDWDLNKKLTEPTSESYKDNEPAEIFTHLPVSHSQYDNIYCVCRLPPHNSHNQHYIERQQGHKLNNIVTSATVGCIIHSFMIYHNTRTLSMHALLSVYEEVLDFTLDLIFRIIS